MPVSNTLKNLIEDNIELFSLPDIVIQLNKLLNDPDSSIDSISELIIQDAALTIRLLKLVNSAYYSFSSPIDTISQAINVIGTTELSDFIIATKMIQQFNFCPMKLVTIDSFWRHNLACATAAKTISVELKIKNTEQIYISGLIHDIGKLLLYVTQPILCEHLITKMSSRDENIHELEFKIFGFTHGDVGSQLLSQWQLPQMFIETTQYHHDITKKILFPVESAIIHLANGIANLIEKPLSYDDALPVDESVWTILGINPEMLVTLTHKSELKYKISSTILIDSETA